MNENDSIYKILDDATRSWWYYRQLRSQGKDELARALERKSTLGKVYVLRRCLENSGYATVGRGGITIHYMTHGRLEICSLDVRHPMVRCCIRLGIPVCDSTTVPDDLIIKTVRLPMASLNPDSEPIGGYGSTSFAPVEYVFRLYEELGATIYNLDPEITNEQTN